MFWGNQIKGKKGWTQRPLKAADSSPDMCLKRDAATDAKNRGKERRKGREWAELREENEGKIKEREEGDRKLQQAKQERKVSFKKAVPESRVVKENISASANMHHINILS